MVPAHSAYDVIFVDPGDGKTLLEGSTFSVFFVDRQGRILTYPLDGKILDSITRRIVLDLLQARHDLSCEEVPVSSDEVPLLSEAFIVSTTRGVLPVGRIDAQVVGDGKPGPKTRLIMGIFDEYLRSY